MDGWIHYDIEFWQKNITKYIWWIHWDLEFWQKNIIKYNGWIHYDIDFWQKNVTKYIGWIHRDIEFWQKLAQKVRVSLDFSLDINLRWRIRQEKEKYFLSHFLYEEDIYEEKHSGDIITTSSSSPRTLQYCLTIAPKACQTVCQSYYIRIAVLLGDWMSLFMLFL